jgi:hypothetical protein
MTSNSPSSPDGSSLPPRHRPNLAKLAKGSTEEDLWALDSDEELGDSQEHQAGVPSLNPAEPSLPPPRKEEKTKPPAAPEGEPVPLSRTPESRNRINLNVGRNRQQVASPCAPASYSDAEFEDLDTWDDIEPVSTGIPKPSQPAPLEETKAAATPEPKSEPLAEVASVDKALDEFATPRSEDSGKLPLPRLALSKAERLGLFILILLLGIGGGIGFLASINRLPSESAFGQFEDFPVEGERLTIERAESFWREPTAADIARRGTHLLPVLSLTVRGGPGALRVFFRDAEGKVVGDAVSRSIGEAGALEINATAGFEEAWMHDTYSTIGGEPWTVEILEGPSQGAPSSEFKSLLKLNVSTERR